MKTKYPFKSDISKKLKSAGITVKRIAQDLDVSERQAWNIFHGKHLTLESAALIAGYLNTTIDEVYFTTRGAA